MRRAAIGLPCLTRTVALSLSQRSSAIMEPLFDMSQANAVPALLFRMEGGRPTVRAIRASEAKRGDHLDELRLPLSGHKAWPGLAEHDFMSDVPPPVPS